MTTTATGWAAATTADNARPASKAGSFLSNDFMEKIIGVKDRRTGGAGKGNFARGFTLVASARGSRPFFQEKVRGVKPKLRNRHGDLGFSAVKSQPVTPSGCLRCSGRKHCVGGLPASGGAGFGKRDFGGAPSVELAGKESVGIFFWTQNVSHKSKRRFPRRSLRRSLLPHDP